MKISAFVVVVGLMGCGARIVPEPGGSGPQAKTGDDAAVAVDGGAGETSSPPSSSASDAGSPSSSASDAAATGSVGCPMRPPTSGQSCIASSGIPDDHFYCHYFAPGETCADEYKCTQSDGTGEPAHFYASGAKNCGFTVDACAEGQSCGSVFEPDGACIVGCSRRCTCDHTTGLLKCTPVACTD